MATAIDVVSPTNINRVHTLVLVVGKILIDKEKTMTYTLLIWEEIPENNAEDPSALLFMIPNEEAEPYRHYLTEAHGNYLNCSENNIGIEFVAQAVSTDSHENGMDEYIGIFKPYQIDKAKPIEDTFITHVYHSGWVM